MAHIDMSLTRLFTLMTGNKEQHVQPTRAAAVCIVISLTCKHQFWFLVPVAWAGKHWAAGEIGMGER